MKYFITIFSAAIILGGCNKKGDEVKIPAPDSSHTAADSLQNVLKNLDKNQNKTHRGALEQLIYLDRAGPLPPHLLPIKDVTLIEKTDSTASYALTSGSTGAKIKVDMKRRINGTDTTWIHTKIDNMK